MLRQLADTLNAAGTTRRVVAAQFPEEIIELSTAVTILESSNKSPIGWSLRRVLQRRGNVVITDRRVFIQSGFWSPLSVIWTAAFIIAAYMVVDGQTETWPMLALSGILLLQRRPYTQNLLFESIKDVQFGSVQGITVRGDVLVFDLGTKALHLVTSKVVPTELKHKLEVRIRGYGKQNERV